MTKRQFQVLAFLFKYISENKYTPTLREIQIALNISSYTSVAQCVNGLHRRGYIEKIPYAKRSIRLSKKGLSEFEGSGQIANKIEISYNNKFNNMILEYSKVEKKEAEFEKSVNLFISKFNRFIETNHFNKNFIINGYSDLYKFKELASLLKGEIKT